MQRASSFLIAIAIAILGIFLLHGNPYSGNGRQVVAREKLTLSVAQYSLSSPVYVAREKAYFAAEGVDVTLREAAVGKLALDDVIEGKADLGTVADTPVVHAVARGEPLAIVATLGNTDAEYSILARKDRGIAGFSNLQGKKIGLSKDATAQYYFYRLLIALGLPDQKLEVIDIDPSMIVAALVQGKVDAIVTLQPYLSEAQFMLGESALHLVRDDLVRTNGMVVGSPDYVRSHPVAVKAVLRALIRAEQAMLSSPEEARRIVAREIHMDPLLLAHAWPNYHFEVALDQSLLVTLEEENRWAMARQLVPGAKVPNFLKSINYSFLKEIRPESVQLVR